MNLSARCELRNVRGELPDASLVRRRTQGSFDSAGTSLREVSAALRMTGVGKFGEKPQSLAGWPTLSTNAGLEALLHPKAVRLCGWMRLRLLRSFAPLGRPGAAVATRAWTDDVACLSMSWGSAPAWFGMGLRLRGRGPLRLALRAGPRHTTGLVAFAWDEAGCLRGRHSADYYFHFGRGFLGFGSYF